MLSLTFIIFYSLFCWHIVGASPTQGQQNITVTSQRPMATCEEPVHSWEVKVNPTTCEPVIELIKKDPLYMKTQTFGPRWRGKKWQVGTDPCIITFTSSKATSTYQGTLADIINRVNDVFQDCQEDGWGGHIRMRSEQDTFFAAVYGVEEASTETILPPSIAASVDTS